MQKRILSEPQNVNSEVEIAPQFPSTSDLQEGSSVIDGSFDGLNPNNFGEGYVVLSRSSLHSEVFQDKDPFYWKAWMWMLMRANHTGVERNGFVYQRGEFYTWYGEIIESLTYYRRHKKIKPTKQQVRILLRWFVSRGMIVVTPVESKKLTYSSQSPHNKGLGGTHRGEYDGVKIRVVNYNAYQTSENYRKTGKNTQWNTPGTQVEHNNKNDFKNENNEIEEIEYGDVSAFQAETFSFSPKMKKFLNIWGEAYKARWAVNYRLNDKDFKATKRIMKWYSISEIESDLKNWVQEFFSYPDLRENDTISCLDRSLCKAYDDFRSQFQMFREIFGVDEFKKRLVEVDSICT